MNRINRSRRFFYIIPFAILGVFVFGGIVMLLWNNALSPVLHISAITFWQGLGILVLSKILFSSFGGRGGYRRHSWKEKMMWENMTPEQKEKLKEEWKKRSHRWGHGSWEAETNAGQVNK